MHAGVNWTGDGGRVTHSFMDLERTRSVLQKLNTNDCIVTSPFDPQRSMGSLGLCPPFAIKAVKRSLYSLEGGASLQLLWAPRHELFTLDFGSTFV